MSDSDERPADPDPAHKPEGETKVSKPKRKRKRKKPRQDASRPPYARGYPRHPELDALVAAFEAGNFALVRSEAPALIDGGEEEAVRNAARDLRRRIDPSPSAVYVWALGVALLVFLYAFYLSHGH